MQVRHLGVFLGAIVSVFVGHKAVTYAQQSLRCAQPVGITWVDQIATVTCPAPPVPPVGGPVLTALTADPSLADPGQTTTFRVTVTGGQAPLGYAITLAGKPVAFAPVTATSGTVVAPAVPGAYLYTVTVADALKRSNSRQVTVTVRTPPVPPGGQVWGSVTAAELGECPAASHDRYLVDGGDGWRYRVWHPQVDPTGCVYGHEHGDDPGRQTHPWVRTNWEQRMGYAARRDTTHPGQPNGHEEPHNGYKVHVVNIGDVNDEGRVNQTATTSMPHMGTGGPARFSVDRHSVQIADWHQNGIHHTAIAAMFATGTTGNPVCADRVNATTKDGLILGMTCKMDSSYEIWSMRLDVERAGQTVLTKFVSPAVFDPITVHNKANPSELVFAWDPRVAAFKNFPNDWSDFRGCAREGYSQVGYHYNGNDPSEEYLLDVRTNTIVATASAFTTRLIVGRSNTAGNPPFSSDILQFKKRRDHCEQRAKLSLTN